MKHHIIYVPGIKDDFYKGQSVVVWFWWLWGVRGHCHAMPWFGQEAYEPKFARLLAQIDRYLEAGQIVSLVGASAGASAVINAYHARPGKINGVVTICPKINHPETVRESLHKSNPAFKTSLANLQVVLLTLTDHDKRKFLTVYSPGDDGIPYEDTVIPGVAEHKLPSLTHGYAIVYALTFGARYLIGFLKKQAKTKP